MVLIIMCNIYYHLCNTVIINTDNPFLDCTYVSIHYYFGALMYPTSNEGKNSILVICQICP